VAAIKTDGGHALALETDVSDPVSVSAMVEQTLSALGRIDILVNNAGIAGTLGPVLDLTFETWNHVIGVNLSGVFLCSQAVARVMVERKTPGRIINVGSINGSIAQRNAAAYVASKGGVDMLTKALAVDLAEYGILVNCIAPGSIRVERNAGYFDAEPLATTFKKAIPLGHPGTGDDIAGAAAFLASDDSAFMTGAVLVVDGGFSSYFRID
jgi:NAD(P)-dependent dehydrogenase (short-subunit alcohol dehydrogenase family)